MFTTGKVPVQVIPEILYSAPEVACVTRRGAITCRFSVKAKAGPQTVPQPADKGIIQAPLKFGW